MADPVDVIRWSDLVIAGCTLLGPVLAVQAQKWAEGFREKEARRLTIFRTLMATRAMNLSAGHVEALNAVPIDFQLNPRRRTKILNYELPLVPFRVESNLVARFIQIAG